MTAARVHGAVTRARTVAAAALYLLLACWAYRVVLPAPASVVPSPVREAAPTLEELYLSDQRYVVGTIASNARKVVTGPRGLYGPGPCFPLDRPFTLGEHMFGEGLLGALPWASSHEPILTYNAVLVLGAWLAAMSMYALALHWTRSALAALVAGILFAFHPARIGDPAHPYVYGNLWTPLALLFAHRLFAHERWRDALGLALFLGLQLLESFYQVLALLLLGGVYGVDLLVRHARRVPRLAGKLLFVGLVTAAVAALVLGPYLHTRDTWGVLQGRAGAVPLYRPADYLPGGPASIGWAALALAGVGVADRLRRRIPGGTDPRLVLLVAGLVVWWATLAALRVPLLGVRLPSPIVLLAGWVPGLDAVRVLPSLRFGVFLIVDFLAAYGVVAIVALASRAGRWACIVTSVAIACAATVDVLAAPGAAGHPQLVAVELRPADDVVDAYRTLATGPVLDLPVPSDPLRRVHLHPIFIFLAAFHGQPVAACYNSFSTALQDDVRELAHRLPDRGAADALHALGFRTLVVHEDLAGERALRKLAPLLGDRTRVHPIARPAGETLYRMDSPVPIVADPARLEPTPTSATPAALSQPGQEIEFVFWNPPGATYVQPTPIEPSPVIARWRDASGAIVAEESLALLLPTALGEGQEGKRRVALRGPAVAGAYQVDLVRAAAVDRVLARRRVDVLGGALDPSGRS